MEMVLQLMADGMIDVCPLVRAYALRDVLQAFDDAGAQRVLKPVGLAG